MSRKAIALYVALVLAVSWALQIPAIALFGLDSGVTKAVFVGIMWSPTIIAIVFLVRDARARAGLLWRVGKLAYWPLGMAVETATGFAMVAILVGAGLATSGWFAFAANGVTILGGPWLLGLGSQSWPLFLLNVCVTGTAYSVFSLVATTGEEFAWRGFLQGHLIRQFGTRRGILVLAAIWGAWHLPGLLAGFDFPAHPLMCAFVLFPLQMIGASLFFGWLTLRSGSFWPAALAHAAVNSIQQGVIDNLHLRIPPLWGYLVHTSLILAVGALCWFALRPRARD